MERISHVAGNELEMENELISVTTKMIELTGLSRTTIWRRERAGDFPASNSAQPRPRRLEGRRGLRHGSRVALWSTGVIAMTA